MALVLFEIRDNIALLTLNNPDKRNMLTLEVCRQIVDYVAQAEAEKETGYSTGYYEKQSKEYAKSVNDRVKKIKSFDYAW